MLTDMEKLEAEARDLAMKYATALRTAQAAELVATERAAALLSLDDDWVEAQLAMQAAREDQAQMAALLQRLRPDEADEKAVSVDFGTVRVTWGKRSIESVTMSSEKARELLAQNEALALAIGITKKPGEVPDKATITVRAGFVPDADAKAALLKAGA